MRVEYFIIIDKYGLYDFMTVRKKKKIPYKKLTNWSWKNETLAVNVVLIWGIYIYMDLVSLLGIMMIQSVSE